MANSEFNEAGKDNSEIENNILELRATMLESYETHKKINEAPLKKRESIRTAYRADIGNYNTAISKAAREVEGGASIVENELMELEGTEFYKNAEQVRQQFFTILNPTNLLTDKDPDAYAERKAEKLEL